MSSISANVEHPLNESKRSSVMLIIYSSVSEEMRYAKVAQQPRSLSAAAGAVCAASFGLERRWRRAPMLRVEEGGGGQREAEKDSKSRKTVKTLVFCEKNE